MAEVNRGDGGRPTHTRGAPEQTGARAGAHIVSKQVFIILATNDLDATCKDASIIHSSVDWDLPTGLMAHTATYCYCAPGAHQIVDFIEHAAVIIITKEDQRGL